MSIRLALLMASMIMLLVGTTPPARAQQDALGIAAVVNEQAISAYDLRNRLDLVIDTSNLPDQPQVRERILPQVLRNLIDERLKMQEARRLGIKVSDAEVEARIHDIERRNNMPAGGMANFLANGGIDPITLDNQVRADLAWLEVIRQLFAPQVTISDREVDDAIAAIEKNAGKPEYLVSEIFLPIDDPANEGDVTQLVNRLVQQLQQGASFSALAQNFSQSPTAAQGGDMGWIRPEVMGDKLASALSQMSEGQLAGPIRTDEGFYILALRGRRTAPSLGGDQDSGVKVTMRQLHLAVANDATAAEVADVSERAKELTGTAENCEQFKETAAQNGSGLSGSLGTVETSKLPEELRRRVGNLAANQTTEPIRTADGVIVIMVCQREGGAPARAQLEEQRDRVRAMLLNERLSVRARQHLRNLRRSAFIDIRI